VTALTELPEVGKATHCILSVQSGPHPARRYVWHHILPQVCGGLTTPANLASLCDSCHYTVHDLMWLMANGTPLPGPPHTAAQFKLATQGYQLAVAAGTAGKMPKEA
jgi:hypothetical protein